MTAGQKLRGVGLGTGYFSQFHYEAWARIPEVEIVAVCAPEAARAGAVCARYGIPRQYAAADEAIAAEAPDFVDIITPPATHRALACAAADRGAHVICQKPLAPSLDE